jgi:hypothetical protein
MTGSDRGLNSSTQELPGWILYLFWIALAIGGLFGGAFVGLIIGTVGLVVTLLMGIAPEVADFPLERGMGVLAGFGAALGVLILWGIAHAAFGKRRPKSPYVRPVVIGAMLGSLIGGTVGAYRVDADYCGPDGASNVNVRLTFSNLEIYRFFARRSIFWPGFGDDCEGTVVGVAMGAFVAALTASGSVAILRRRKPTHVF